MQKSKGNNTDEKLTRYLLPTDPTHKQMEKANNVKYMPKKKQKALNLNNVCCQLFNKIFPTFLFSVKNFLYIQQIFTSSAKYKKMEGYI